MTEERQKQRKALLRKLRDKGLSHEEAMDVMGDLVEYTQQSYVEGFQNGFNEGFEKGKEKVNTDLQELRTPDKS